MNKHCYRKRGQLMAVQESARSTAAVLRGLWRTLRPGRR
jgi:hypothetical protein